MMMTWKNPISNLQEAVKKWKNQPALMCMAVTQKKKITIDGTVLSHNIMMKRIWGGAQWYINPNYFLNSHI